MFLVGIPLLLLLVQRALASPEGWAHMQARSPVRWVKLVAIVLVWAYLHHLLAGIRHVLMDMHYGVELKAARQSAAFVFVLALAPDPRRRGAAMVTPNRIVVGAHYGWRDWLVQRVTAVVMAAYTLLAARACSCGTAGSTTRHGRGRSAAASSASPPSSS